MSRERFIEFATVNDYIERLLKSCIPGRCLQIRCRHLAAIEIQPEGFIKKADGVFQQLLKVPDLVG